MHRFLFINLPCVSIKNFWNQGAKIKTQLNKDNNIVLFHLIS